MLFQVQFVKGGELIFMHQREVSTSEEFRRELDEILKEEENSKRDVVKVVLEDSPEFLLIAKG